MEKAEDELKICEFGRVRFEPVVALIERLMAKKDDVRIIVAIDGKCGSGKTTLGSYLQKKFDCNLFHMDDFFLQNHQRTEKRLKEAGGNVDYERFKEEVLEPLLSGRLVKYRTFNCILRVIDKEYEVYPKKINIIEGSYSQHPYFENPYDLRIFLDIDDQTQIENIKKRNGLEKLEQFRTKWIPMENRYFDEFKIKEKSLVVEWKKPPKNER
jgi:uridine kinase